MRYLIPSFRRPTILAEKSLAYLERCGVDPADCLILVANEGEMIEYADELADDWADRLVITEKGLSNSRNFARTRLLDDDERVVWLDDDIESVQRRVNDKVTEEAAIQDVSADGFEAALGSGVALWGIYPSLNPFYMKARIRAGLWHCVGCFYGEVNSRNEKLLLEFGDAKEDYERCLRHMEVYGGVARLDWFAPKTVYYRDKGGITDRTPDTVQENIRRLQNRWPGLVKDNPRRKSGYPEILLARL